MKKILSVLMFAVAAVFGFPEAGAQNVTWRSLGPVNVDQQSGDGVSRVNQVKFHPTDPKKMYLVSVTGGLFISNDEGKSWNTTNTDWLPSTTCASVCIDYSDDQVLYLGTGDPNYYNGRTGLWKSRDGGKTWRNLSGLGTRLIVEILQSPLDPKVLVAATNDGIWNTSDSGQTWTQRLPEVEFTHMVASPAPNSTIVYATSRDGFYISSNMGVTWNQVDLSPAGSTGIEGGGRIAVSASNPSVVYLIYMGDSERTPWGAIPEKPTPVLRLNLVSDSVVSSVTRVRDAVTPNLNGYSEYERGQGNYDHVFVADPDNYQILYTGGHRVWKSVDGGVSWEKKYSNLHTDYHQLVFSPFDHSKLYMVSDGGIYVSFNRGDSWNPLLKGLTGTENNTAAQSPINKNVFSAGAQDNGEYLFDGKGWRTNGGGDVNIKMAFDYQSDAYRYALNYDKDGTKFSGAKKYFPDNGQSSLNFPFRSTEDGNDVEIAFFTTSANIAYVSCKDIYRTDNLTSNPPTWKRLTFSRDVITIASPPDNPNVLYAVTTSGKILRSDNALAATPSFIVYKAPETTIETAAIGIVNSNPDIFYLSCGKNIYRVKEKGAAWDDVTGNLPTPRTNIIKIIHDDYSTDESVYFATNKAVYYKNKNMEEWENYSNGIPTIADISHLMIFNDGTDNSVLRVSTRGRGTFEANLKGRPALLREPENPSSAVAGLSYKCYNGDWESLPDFSSLTPVLSGTTTNGFDLTLRNQDDQFGFVFTGYVNIPADGQYTFYLSSDDGSRLYIGNELVVDNDGLHSETETSGTIGLKAGYHAIRVEYFDNAVDEILSVSYSSSGLAKQAIPATSLKCLPGALPCIGTGSMSRKLWKDVSGNTIKDIPLSSAPTVTDNIYNYLHTSTLDDEADYGEQLMGYLCPPYTGSYTFYISGSDAAELYVSSDATAEKKQKLLSLTNGTGDGEFYIYPSQKSATVTLTAGQNYYIEVLHKKGGGEGHVAVGWQLPTGEYERPIPANRILPYSLNSNAPVVSLTGPANGSSILQGASVTLTATASHSSQAISKVEFFSNGAKVGEDASSPYSVMYTPAAVGTYTLLAKATTTGGLTNVSSSAQVTVLKLRNPENPSPVVNGVNFKYYEGNFNFCGAVLAMSPDKTGSVKNFDIITFRDVTDNYAFQYEGYINIPTDGIYTFYLDSDDGSMMYIGDTAVVNNDRSHGNGQKAGSPVGLKAGKHAFRLIYFEGGGSESVTLYYEGPGITKRIVPATALFIKGTSGAVPPTVSLNDITSGTGEIFGSSFSLTATALDIDGTVSKVEYLVNGVKLGESTTSPYELNWSNVSPGTYSILALATDNNGLRGSSAAVTVNVNGYRNPDNPGATVQGVNYKYYTGDFSRIAQFVNATPDRTSATSNFDLSVRDSWVDDNFAFSYHGYISVPVQGIYTFYLRSDDGSNLSIGDTLVVDNDGYHGSDDEVSGSIALKAGLHAITVRYFEGSGNEVIYVDYEGPTISRQAIPASVLFRPDISNLAPSVSLTSPGTGATYAAPAVVELGAEAFDIDGSIALVEYYAGTSFIGSTTVYPYYFKWTNVQQGVYSITARVYDNLGLSTASKATSITVTGTGNAVPAVSLTAPQNNAVYTAPANVTITANATDSDGTIAKVEFFQGTVKLGEALSSPYTYTWSNVAAGTYSLTALATDNAGATNTSAAISVTVQGANTAPTVSITSPANNAAYTAPATITINATASDADGTISKVEFYQGNTLLGSALSAPYSYTWNSVAAGTYTIMAIAYDNASAVTTSSPVTVTVSGATTCLLDEAIPSASNYVIRNAWNDQNAGSSVTTDATGLKVTHRAYGQSELYVIETGKFFSITSGQAYTIRFDFKDYTIPVTGVDVGFALGLNSQNNGPNLVQTLVAAPSGYSSSGFTTKSVNLTAAYSGNVNLVFRLRWNGQPAGQVTDYIKNITVCNASSSARMSDVHASSLLISPNPSKEEFSLRTQKAIELLFITDNGGREVYRASDIAEGSTLEFGREFDFGIYSILVKYADGREETLKILKTK